MTNEEAIKAIEVIRNYILKDPSWLKSFTDKANEAVDMAINALKAQELSNDSPELDKKNGELISNKRTGKRTETHACDLISRQAAIDMIDEISIEIDEGHGFQYAKWRKFICDLKGLNIEGWNEDE